MGADVFISYSRSDGKVADSLVEALEHAGISCFIDRKGISGGEQFIKIISQEIVKSDIFLFIASNNSFDSKWTMKEVAYAFQEKNRQSILPLLIDDTPLPDTFKFLFSDINMIRIKSEDDMDDIIKAIKLMLRKEHDSISMFTEFYKQWLQDTDEVERVLQNLFIEHFGPIEKFILSETKYYKHFLSRVEIPYRIVYPRGTWTGKYDFDLLKLIIFTTSVDNGNMFWDYSLELDKQWKLNPQNEPQIQICVRCLDGFIFDNWFLNEMTENDIIALRYTLFKILIDSVVRWEMPEYKELIETENRSALDKLKNELFKCQKSVFLERTKLYDKVGTFHEGRAMVYLKGSIGFIDTQGKLVTPVEWEDASDFSFGLACVADEHSGMYGYIDSNGSLVIPCKWESARPFTGEWAEVKNEEGHWIRIDRKGNSIP